MRPAWDTLPSLGFVSTYPPTSCGLATFTAALRGAIARRRGSDDGLDVVSLAEGELQSRGPEVVHEHVNGDLSSLEGAIDALNATDVVFVQHEYGIYGGQDGAEVLDLVSNLDVPTVVTLHTVLDNPTRRQKDILERIVDLTEQTIVMSDTALRRLEGRYDLDEDKVRVVPHGATASLAGPSLAHGTRPVVLTWGLIGPGKGLETAIEAFADLRDLSPQPRYIILGRTHPKVRLAQGDTYRQSLVALAHDLGLDEVVEFDGRYLDIDALTLAVRQADIVLLPYESTEQVTSGVLVEALAAGKPVVATAFPHAVEMLGTGAGLVVPHAEPEAMAEALRGLLTDPALAARMATVAGSIGATLHWPVVADEYESIAAGLVVRRLPVAARDDLAQVG